ncbi:MAG: esterase [Microbacteriaceae bacterium]|nr:esterase [Microbacteriaceae bacterium]
MDALLSLNIMDGPVVGVVYTLALGALLYLALRRPTRRWIITGLAGLLAGALLAGGVLLLVGVTNVLGVGLTQGTVAWVYVTFAGMGLAIVNLWRSQWYRKVLASLAVVLFLVVGTVGINMEFGLDRTVADLAGMQTQKKIHVPTPVATTDPSEYLNRLILSGASLWDNWIAPADLPTQGTIGQVTIPNTASGFAARPAGLYLPPAALVAKPPPLPLVIMLMGQPGNPDPSFQKPILDAFAARHGGLAPIVLVVDQIGNPANDPGCTDSTKFGKVETYLTQDAVSWARVNLHVIQDPAHWTIAGYSNGGECAAYLGARFPQVWGNVLDISGEEVAGDNRQDAMLAGAFAGNRAAYEASKPQNILAAGHYDNTVGIFTVGSDDSAYRKQAQDMNRFAAAAGWKTTYFEVLNGGHVLGALNGGLQEGYTVLFPRLGLSRPDTAP